MSNDETESALSITRSDTPSGGPSRDNPRLTNNSEALIADLHQSETLDFDESDENDSWFEDDTTDDVDLELESEPSFNENGSRIYEEVLSEKQDDSFLRESQENTSPGRFEKTHDREEEIADEEKSQSTSKLKGISVALMVCAILLGFGVVAIKQLQNAYFNNDAPSDDAIPFNEVGAAPGETKPIADFDDSIQVENTTEVIDPSVQTPEFNDATVDQPVEVATLLQVSQPTSFSELVNSRVTLISYSGTKYIRTEDSMRYDIDSNILGSYTIKDITPEYVVAVTTDTASKVINLPYHAVE